MGLRMITLVAEPRWPTGGASAGHVPSRCSSWSGGSRPLGRRVSTPARVLDNASVHGPGPLRWGAGRQRSARGAEGGRQWHLPAEFRRS
jgi:hypothetical protein